MKFLDDRQMTQRALTADGIRLLISNTLTEELRGLMTSLTRPPPPPAPDPTPSPYSLSCFLSNTDLFSSSELFMWEGRFHRLPADFTLPKGPVREAWTLWCCGNKALKVPALRLCAPDDFTTAVRHRFWDFQKLMNTFQQQLESKNEWIDNPTLDDATALYYKLDLATILPAVTPKGRKRRDIGQKSWPTFARALFPSEK
jgi:hypothetical protein